MKSRTDVCVPCETRCYPFPIFVAIPPLSPLSLSETKHQSLPGARIHPLSGPYLQGVLVAVKKERRITPTQCTVWNWLLLPRTGQKFSRSQEITIWCQSQCTESDRAIGTLLLPIAWARPLFPGRLNAAVQHCGSASGLPFRTHREPPYPGNEGGRCGHFSPVKPAGGRRRRAAAGPGTRG